MNAGIRIFMVEDHPAVRQGLRLLLEQEGIQVCGEGECTDEALKAIPSCDPDLVLVDLCLGEDDGLELLGQLLLLAPARPLLVYSMFEDAAHVRRALRAGAMGYVTKREAAEVLALAIRECMAGRRYLSSRAQRSLDDTPTQAGGQEVLSAQEQQVYALLGQGFSTSDIAREMELSPRTIESYCGRILVKLGLRGMKELRRQAVSVRV